MSQHDVDREAKELLDSLRPRKNPWPGVVVFVSLLVFFYKMSELLLR